MRCLGHRGRVRGVSGAENDGAPSGGLLGVDPAPADVHGHGPYPDQLMHRFVFVLEQTLGHVAHSRNLVRALGRRSDIDATIIPIAFDPIRRVERLPGLRNWSLRASRATRAALDPRLSE